MPEMIVDVVYRVYVAARNAKEAKKEAEKLVRALRSPCAIDAAGAVYGIEVTSVRPANPQFKAPK